MLNYQIESNFQNEFLDDLGINFNKELFRKKLARDFNLFIENFKMFFQKIEQI